MSALKTIQDKLAIEANDFQALQKGTPGLSSRDPSRRSTREPRADLFPHPSSQIWAGTWATASSSCSSSARTTWCSRYARATGILRANDRHDRHEKLPPTLKNDPPADPSHVARFVFFFFENKRAQELERLEDDANVYKLIGPVLIKQDLVEAKSNVEKRLEFIQNETERLDKMVKSMENKQETKHREILELQKKLQTLAAAK
jgi:hypothetical protein